MQCSVAHYCNANRTYTKLKTLSLNQILKLNEAKDVRENETEAKNI